MPMKRYKAEQIVTLLRQIEMLFRGIPEHIRSDNGPELVAEELRKWLAKLGTRTLKETPVRPA